MSIEDTPTCENLSLEWRERFEYAERLKKRVEQIQAYPDGNE